MTRDSRLRTRRFGWKVDPGTGLPPRRGRSGLPTYSDLTQPVPLEQASVDHRRSASRGLLDRFPGSAAESWKCHAARPARRLGRTAPFAGGAWENMVLCRSAQPDQLWSPARTELGSTGGNRSKPATPIWPSQRSARLLTCHGRKQTRRSSMSPTRAAPGSADHLGIEGVRTSPVWVVPVVTAGERT